METATRTAETVDQSSRKPGDTGGTITLEEVLLASSSSSLLALGNPASKPSDGGSSSSSASESLTSS